MDDIPLPSRLSQCIIFAFLLDLNAMLFLWLLGGDATENIRGPLSIALIPLTVLALRELVPSAWWVFRACTFSVLQPVIELPVTQADSPFACNADHAYWLSRIPLMQKGEYVYCIRDITLTGYYKIGHTNQPTARMHRFEVKLPINTHIVHIIHCSDRIAMERHLHHVFADNRRRGEWFDLDDQDIALIKRY